MNLFSQITDFASQMDLYSSLVSQPSRDTFINNIFNYFRRKRFVRTHVKRVTTSELSEIIYDPILKVALKNYLEKNHPYLNQIFLDYWECYNICSKLKWKMVDTKDENIMRKMRKACPIFTEESDILDKLITGDEEINHYEATDKLKESILRRMEDCDGYRLFVNDAKNKKKEVIVCFENIFEILQSIKIEAKEMVLHMLGGTIEF